MKVISIIFSLLFLSFNSFGQAVSAPAELVEAEARLAVLLADLRAAENDQEKSSKNKAFKSELTKVLESREALTYAFPSLSTVGFIDSPDGMMRIVNWNVEQDDFSHSYNCFVLHIDERRDKYYVAELQDISFGMPMQPREVITADQWYGALYYDIIPVKKGSKTLYTVLGWDYFSTMSQMRVIDVLSFTGSTVKLGSPIFKVGSDTEKRIFYEHSKKASMVMKYEPKRERIIFDHLSPESPNMQNFKSFYVPDMTYDAFELKGSKWILHEDVIGVNSTETAKKQTVFVKNEKTGKVERREMKAEWINPDDPDAPIGSPEHVAVTPEDAEEQEAIEKGSNEPEIDKKDKRDPSQVSFYKDIEKKKKRKRKKRKQD